MTEQYSRRGQILLSTALLHMVWAFIRPVGAQAQGQWSTAGNGTDSYTNGNVGIGNSAPTDKLDVSGRVRFSLDAAWPGSNVASIYRSAGTGLTFTGYNGTNTSWYFSNNLGQDVMYNPVGTIGVNFAGRVNILNPSGAFTASNYLQLTGNTSDNGNYPGISFKGGTLANEYPYVQMGNGGLLMTVAGGRHSTNYPNRMQMVLSTNLSGYGYAAFQLWNGTSTTDLLTLKDNGNVGIGATSPAYKLDVTGSINGSGLCIAGDCKTAWSQVGGGGSSQWSNGTGSIYYNTGNVGIGTQTPVQKFQVAGAIGATGTIAAGNTSTGAFLYDDGTNANLAALSGTNARPLNVSGQNIIFSTGTTYAEKMRIDASGNVTVAGNITATGAINAKYQDVAEWVVSSQKLQAGTVVILDPERTNQVIASTESYDTRVAGVISEQPGLILGEGGEGKVKVATTGRVRVKVDATRGPIKIGDLLVTSGEEGVAMKSEPINFNGRLIHSPGTIIGKALEPLAKGKGEILVLLSLQ